MRVWCLMASITPFQGDGTGSNPVIRSQIGYRVGIHA